MLDFLPLAKICVVAGNNADVLTSTRVHAPRHNAAIPWRCLLAQSNAQDLGSDVSLRAQQTLA